MDNCTKVGTFTGNGAAQNISLGFVPDYVRIVNATDSDITHEWFEGMTSGSSIDTGAAVAPNADNGISPYAGSATAARGFTVGTDISENAKVYYYLAIRTSSGA